MECRLNSTDAAVSASIYSIGHGLLLHCVHPAEATHTLLIEFDWLAVFGSSPRCKAESIQFLPQARKELDP